MNRLSMFAANAVATLRNALLLQNERVARGELSALYDLSRALADAPNDLEEILPLVTRRALEMVVVTCARILWLDDAQWVVRAACPIRVLDFDLKIGARIARTDSPLFARIVTQHAPKIVSADDPDLSDADRAALLLKVAHRVYAIPLWVGDRAVGLLTLHEARNEIREPFTAEKLALARGIADQLSSALHRVELFTQLEQSYLQPSCHWRRRWTPKTRTPAVIRNELPNWQAPSAKH